MFKSAVLAGVAALLIAPSAEAGGLSFKTLKASKNWSCGSSGAKYTCSGNSVGSFYTPILGSACCVSSTWTTTTIPSSCTCPFDWLFHTGAKACAPPKVTSTCDCGEGYTYNTNSCKCELTTSSGCSSSQWWNERTGLCCENSWAKTPPTGSCPSGVTCPSSWSWSDSHNCCVPLKPRSPEPDCSNWNSAQNCCGTHTSATPSAGTNHNSGSSGWKHRKGKRDDTYAQSAFDSMYCPEGKVCTVPSANGTAWAWECINPLTELESCGGCISDGTGVDCTSIANAASVGCEQGACKVYSCKKGYTAEGAQCVSN